MEAVPGQFRESVAQSVVTVGESWGRNRARWWAMLAAVTLLVIAGFWHSLKDIYHGATAPESLYSHAMFIPLVSVFFVWRERKTLAAAPLSPNPLAGYPVLLGGCFMLLLGDFLGFMTLVHLAILPVVWGLALLFLGGQATRAIWFPLAFLFFMVPMPYSIISVISFKSKMIATESAVAIGQLLTMNLVRDGAFVFLGPDDRLLVGDVCGGMRSLIALLAFGAIMAYISRTQLWARGVVLLISPLVAIVANVFRIFFLCVIGYFWGSESATGIVHDVSGIGIFAVAFVLLFSAESFLRKVAPARESGGATS